MVVTNNSRTDLSRSTISGYSAGANKGFTLLELMIVLAIVALLAIITVPSFNDSIKRATLDAVRNTLSESLNLARNEALTRKVQTVVCARDIGQGCNSNGDWSQGWVVFADIDADGSFSTRSDQLIHVQDRYQNIRISISGPLQVVYTATGTLQTRVRRSIEICPAENDRNFMGRRMTIASTGGVSHQSDTEC